MGFEKCETCDVSMTLMMSCVGDVAEKLRKSVLCAFNDLSINCIFLSIFHEIHRQHSLMIQP